MWGGRREAWNLQRLEQAQYKLRQKRYRRFPDLFIYFISCCCCCCW